MAEGVCQFGIRVDEVGVVCNVRLKLAGLIEIYSYQGCCLSAVTSDSMCTVFKDKTLITAE